MSVLWRMMVWKGREGTWCIGCREFVGLELEWVSRNEAEVITEPKRAHTILAAPSGSIPWGSKLVSGVENRSESISSLEEMKVQIPYLWNDPGCWWSKLSILSSKWKHKEYWKRSHDLRSYILNSYEQKKELIKIYSPSMGSPCQTFKLSSWGLEFFQTILSSSLKFKGERMRIPGKGNTIRKHNLEAQPGSQEGRRRCEMWH